MAHWFQLPGLPWSEANLCHPGRNPDSRFAHWQAGEHAYCERCRQQTPTLYAVPTTGTASDATCWACALLAMKD